MEIFRKIAEWFAGGEKKQGKKLVYNDSYAYVNEKKGEHPFRGFTGHISFDEETECDVENADFDLVVGNPNYLDGTQEYRAPWSRAVNQIHWYKGNVVKGDLRCDRFESGVFNGTTLIIVKNTMKGDFKGKTLNENVPY